MLIGLSGGPSVAINASMAGIIRAAVQSGKYNNIYGSINGIHGVLNDNLIELTKYSDDHSIKLLCQTPAMALGSCRKKLNENEYADIAGIFDKYNIKSFFYIGGNDSMDTVLKLKNYFKSINSDISIIGVPKTIDNDLPVTDHTPGFGSAAKYLYHTMSEIICDSRIYPVQSVVIVEIMGRDSGWLTLAAALPSFLDSGIHSPPQIVALPEAAFDEKEFLKQVNSLLETQKSVICVVSEGITDKSGDYVGMSAKSGAVDTFGHVYLSGVGKYLEGLVAKEIGCKVRSIELNVMQRCSAHLASKTDITEAFAVGEKAVEYALNGASGITLVFNRVSNSPYKVEIGSTEVENIANKAKDVPQSWLNYNDKVVQKEIVDYMLPLILGDLEFIKDKNELPEILRLY